MRAAIVTTDTPERFVHWMHGMHGVFAGRLIAVVLTIILMIPGAKAVEPTTIPTAPLGTAAPGCTVGQPCTFAAPIFACSYADAEKIAQAGVAQGNGVGMELVRSQSCQAVPAGRPLKSEATQSTRVVYLTEAGQHLGYMPVGVFATIQQAGSCEPERRVPIRITTRRQDIMLYRRGPAPVAVQLSGQGTAKAVGLFQSKMAERREHCTTSVGGSRAEMQRCLGTYQDDESFAAHADSKTAWSQCSTRHTISIKADDVSRGRKHR